MIPGPQTILVGELSQQLSEVCKVGQELAGIVPILEGVALQSHLWVVASLELPEPCGGPLARLLLLPHDQ